jgi:hypothetical protein
MVAHAQQYERETKAKASTQRRRDAEKDGERLRKAEIDREGFKWEWDSGVTKKTKASTQRCRGAEKDGERRRKIPGFGEPGLQPKLASDHDSLLNCYLDVERPGGTIVDFAYHRAPKLKILDGHHN